MKAYYWVVAWATYGLGHAVSKIMNTKYTAWMYPAYNRLMLTSSGASQHIDNGPWTKLK